MKQSLRATARTLDTGEAVLGVPAIEEPVHYTLRHAAQRTAGALKALLIGADEVLPVVAEDLVERIISKDAGAVSHGVYPADVKQAFQVAAGQDRCRGLGKGRLLLISGFRRATYGTETHIGDMAKGRQDCKRGCRPRTLCTNSKPLLLLWLGDDFVGLYKLMILLVLGQIVPYSLGNIFSIFRGLNTLKTPGYVTILAGVLNIVLVVILIKHTPLAIYGAGIAMVIAVFSKSALFNVIYLSRLLKFNPWKIWSAMIGGCLPAVVFTAALVFLSDYLDIDRLVNLVIYGSMAFMKGKSYAWLIG